MCRMELELATGVKIVSFQTMQRRSQMHLTFIADVLRNATSPPFWQRHDYRDGLHSARRPQRVSTRNCIPILVRH